jgi:hypothetical protein
VGGHDVLPREPNGVALVAALSGARGEAGRGRRASGGFARANLSVDLGGCSSYSYLRRIALPRTRSRALGGSTVHRSRLPVWSSAPRVCHK